MKLGTLIVIVFIVGFLLLEIGIATLSITAALIVGGFLIIAAGAIAWGIVHSNDYYDKVVARYYARNGRNA